MVSMKWKDIVNNSKKIIDNVDEHGKLPVIKGYDFANLLGIFGYSMLNPGNNITLTHNYKNCKDCSGTKINQQLSRKQYDDIVVRTVKFMDKNGVVPNYTTFGKYNIRPRLLLYCLAKILVFYNRNGRLPKTCWFGSSVFGSHINTGGELVSKLSKITGVSIVNYSTLYKAMSKFEYDYYYNDKQNQSRTLSRMKGNCVDLNQVEFYALKELYSSERVRIVRGLVKCSDGKTYGHVWCQLKINGQWINLDASAASRGKKIGTLICPNFVKITDFNPSWAVRDTGDM